jgi:hypothetical protein
MQTILCLVFKQVVAKCDQIIWGDEEQMDKSISIAPIGKIEKLIYLIRGNKVILDSDLAQLYGVETRVLKQAVRRNRKRFPADFMFELTKEEDNSLRSQNVILKRGKHSKRTGYADDLADLY